MQERLDHDFFRRDPVDCSRELIGAVFEWDGCVTRIVETEAYAALGDEACHTFFRPGAREFVARHDAGIAYVYLNYGMHWLFNILCKGPAGDGFVLFRALQPLAGLEKMAERRGRDRPVDLCSGPGKLTRALGIDGSSHGADFLRQENRAVFRGPSVPVTAGPRIGISRAIDFPWRFTEIGSRFVSR